VKSAVSAAQAAAARIGKVVSTHVIPRPAKGTEQIVLSQDTVGLDKPNTPKPVEVLPEPEITASEPKEGKKPKALSRKAGKFEGELEPDNNG
jgi:microcompartment protein CcmL/EutN